MKKNWKRILTPLLVLCLVIAAAVFIAQDANAAETVDAGTCGENVEWALSDTGILYIYGKGSMYDESSYATFFSNYYVKTVVIDEGVTSVGTYQFKNCDMLQAVYLPSTCKTINTGAFYNCASLSYVSMQKGLTRIDSYAFYECMSLVEITIPNSVTKIGASAFENCTSLINLELSNKLTYIDSRAFIFCPLGAVRIPASVTVIKDDAFYTTDCPYSSRYFIFLGSAPSLSSGDYFPFYSGSSRPTYLYYPDDGSFTSYIKSKSNHNNRTNNNHSIYE